MCEECIAALAEKLKVKPPEVEAPPPTTPAPNLNRGGNGWFSSKAK